MKMTITTIDDYIKLHILLQTHRIYMCQIWQPLHSALQGGFITKSGSFQSIAYSIIAMIFQKIRETPWKSGMVGISACIDPLNPNINVDWSLSTNRTYLVVVLGIPFLDQLCRALVCQGWRIPTNPAIK